MGRGLAWLLLAATSGSGTTGTSSTGDNSVGSDSGTSSGTEASSSTTEHTTSSSATDSSTTAATYETSTSDPSFTPTGCLSAPEDDVGPCLTVAPPRATDACDCRQGAPSPAALLLALLVFGLRRRSRAEMIDALALSERLPPDVVARLRRRREADIVEP